METSTGEIIAKLKNICDKLEASRQHQDADTLREAIAYMTDVTIAAELLRHSRASQALFDSAFPKSKNYTEFLHPDEASQ